MDLSIKVFISLLSFSVFTQLHVPGASWSPPPSSPNFLFLLLPFWNGLYRQEWLEQNLSCTGDEEALDHTEGCDCIHKRWCLLKVETYIQMVELPDVGSWNWTQVFCKIIMSSYSVSLQCSPTGSSFVFFRAVGKSKAVLERCYGHSVDYSIICGSKYL